MFTEINPLTYENYEISINGFVILTHTLNHTSDDDLYKNKTHPLDFLKKWITDSKITIPACGIKIKYIRHQIRVDKYHVGNMKCAFTIHDMFSIKFGMNEQRDEQDLYLVSFDHEAEFDDLRKEEYYTPNIGKKSWYMMYDMEHGAVPVVNNVPEDEKDDWICEGHGFVADHEWMTKKQSECLLALCQAREGAEYQQFN